MDYHKLAELLFPHIDKTPEDYRNEMYPQRQLPQGAVVDRFAPSPTGFLHIGGFGQRAHGPSDRRPDYPAH